MQSSTYFLSVGVMFIYLFTFEMVERKKVEESVMPGWEADPHLSNTRLTPYQLGYWGGCAPLHFHEYLCERNCMLPLGVVASTLGIHTHAQRSTGQHSVTGLPAS